MNDGTDLTPPDPWMAPPPPPPPPSPSAPRRRVIGRRTATAALAGGLVVGGIAGGYVISQAATATPSASSSPSAAGNPGYPGHPGFAGAGPAAAQQDLQQVAAVIGITSAQLRSELSAGKTIAAVAAEHNVSAATVISTLVADENAEIDAAVKSGQLTQAQATQMKTQTTQRVTDLVNGTRPAFGPGGPGAGPHGLQAEDEQLVAGVLGISTTQLQSELQAGKTIAAIAKQHNVASSSVISAWAASENAEIDKRVAAGQETSAQGAQEKTQTTQRVTDEVNGTRPSGPPGGGWGGPGPGGAAPTS